MEEYDPARAVWTPRVSISIDSLGLAARPHGKLYAIADEGVRRFVGALGVGVGA